MSTPVPGPRRTAADDSELADHAWALKEAADWLRANPDRLDIGNMVAINTLVADIRQTICMAVVPMAQGSVHKYECATILDDKSFSCNRARHIVRTLDA